MRKNYFLVLVDGPTVVKKFVLAKGTCIIGRADDVDFCINSNDVSRHHALVRYNRKQYIIEDLKSTNGTIVNGKKVNKHSLQPGDEIVIGDFLLLFDDGSLKMPYVDATEIQKRGGETAIIEHKFGAIKQKITDDSLRTAFTEIERAVRKSRKRLSSLAHADRLTGLYNRQYFDKIAPEEFATAQTSGQHLSVLFIDIDYFKHVNDRYGHKTGDRALQVVAKLIRSSCRKSDIVARYGGEEIVVILPNTMLGDATKVASDIQTIIARQAKNIIGLKLTVSIGVATFPEDGDDLAVLLDRADKALYRAKREGRNRVCTYDKGRCSIHR